MQRGAGWVILIAYTIPCGLGPRNRILRAAAVLGNIAASLLGLRGAFDPHLRWQPVRSPKERACGRALTRFRIAWVPGPTVAASDGRRYRADLELPDHVLLLEVISDGEFERDTPERLDAFRAHGFRVEIVRDPREVFALVAGMRR